MRSGSWVLCGYCCQIIVFCVVWCCLCTIEFVSNIPKFYDIWAAVFFDAEKVLLIEMVQSKSSFMLHVCFLFELCFLNLQRNFIILNVVLWTHAFKLVALPRQCWLNRACLFCPYTTFGKCIRFKHFCVYCEMIGMGRAFGESGFRQAHGFFPRVLNRKHTKHSK